MGTEIIAQDCQLTLGSASAIFASGMSKLGYPVTFVSQVGLDIFGDFCIRALHQSGVSTKNVSRNAEVKTGVTIALSGVRDRALITYPGAIATLASEQLNMSLLKGHQHLHLTSYYLQRGLRPSFPDILRRAKAQGLTTSFDPNTDPSGVWSKTINRVLRNTDVLFVNESEATNLTGIRQLKNALDALGLIVPCAVIKRGRRGALAIQNKNVFADSGFKIESFDTTGSGDSFDAGFISAYLREAPLAECLRVGNACGALSAQRAGGTAGQPNQQQLKAFLRTQTRRPMNGQQAN
jgi:sugar/nucleoside kinase (ribokinase family)